jgi:hypothetical protein
MPGGGADLGRVSLPHPDDGVARVEGWVGDETERLSLNQMAELFDRDKSVISRHIGNVFEEGELERPATVAFCATVQTEGGRPVECEVGHRRVIKATATASRLGRVVACSVGSREAKQPPAIAGNAFGVWVFGVGRWRRVFGPPHP